MLDTLENHESSQDWREALMMGLRRGLPELTARSGARQRPPLIALATFVGSDQIVTEREAVSESREGDVRRGHQIRGRT
jgi:hypothetical protein